MLHFILLLIQPKDKDHVAKAWASRLPLRAEDASGELKEIACIVLDPTEAVSSALLTADDVKSPEDGVVCVMLDPKYSTVCIFSTSIFIIYMY